MSATVAIRRASGKRSNVAAEDYNPATMTLWDAPVAPSAASIPAPMPTPTPDPKRKTGRARRG